MCYCPCRTCPVLLVPVTSRVYFPAHGLTISCCAEDFKITSGGGSNLRLYTIQVGKAEVVKG